ncbi:3'-5' exonuclease [Synechococcus elongatus IITB4]|uniref:3'-5' exonuclease n=1 Tax=Synechococcus elongatus TaxID=32046 RepID=UPI0030CA6CD8
MRSQWRSQDWLAYYRSLATATFTVVDVETTGFHPPQARVIELGVLQSTLSEGIQFQQAELINPDIPIPEAIARFTGITAEMLATAGPPESVLPPMLPRLQTRILVAHNLAFDYRFLTAEYQRLGLNFERSPTEQLCTVQMSRQLLADLPSRSLPQLVQHFGFPVGQSHRAAADVEACWRLLALLLQQIQDSDDQEILQRLGQEWLPLPLAAQLLNCSRSQAQKQLETLASVEPRYSSRNSTPLYRRVWVEQLVFEQPRSPDKSC